jgi:hypothetical protein
LETLIAGSAIFAINPVAASSPILAVDTIPTGGSVLTVNTIAPGCTVLPIGAIAAGLTLGARFSVFAINTVTPGRAILTVTARQAIGAVLACGADLTVNTVTPGRAILAINAIPNRGQAILNRPLHDCQRFPLLSHEGAVLSSADLLSRHCLLAQVGDDAAYRVSRSINQHTNFMLRRHGRDHPKWSG